MTRTLLASALLTFASAASASNGIVVTSYSPPTARISTADVDVGSTAGRVTVERRIQRGARIVCADSYADRLALQPNPEATSCYDMAVSSGLAQLENIAGK